MEGTSIQAWIVLLAYTHTRTRPIEKMLKIDSSVGGKVVLSPSEAVLLAGS